MKMFSRIKNLFTNRDLYVFSIAAAAVVVVNWCVVVAVVVVAMLLLLFVVFQIVGLVVVERLVRVSIYFA